MTADGQHIVVAGDWHGSTTWAVEVIRRTAAQRISTVVHVGDLGIGPWVGRPDTFLPALDAALDRFGCRLLVVPGNHENYDTLVAAPRDDDGTIVLGEHIRALPRGHRWTVGGRRFGALGGAVSVDRDNRLPGGSWWAAEAITLDDVEALGDEPLDVFVTHEAPDGVWLVSQMNVPDDAGRAADYGRRLVRRAVENTRPAVHFCGHWHQRWTDDLTRDDGGTTRVEVLDSEETPGNAVVLSLVDLSVSSLKNYLREEGR